MPAPSVLILRAPGTNCDHETAFAFEQAGARTELVHINSLMDSPRQLGRHQILCIPGGFSYGDDVAAGRILANQIRHRLQDVLSEFKSADKLILGICNGFQVLIKSGILLNDADQPAATLTWNDSGKFEDRWVYLTTTTDRCVFLQGVQRMYLPVAHAEGKFVTRTPEVLAELQQQGQCAVCYCRPDGQADGSLAYPENPNGSIANIAGVCDPTGRVFGLMPHPERHIDVTHHPRWTRGEGQGKADGIAIFENAVQYFQ